MPNSRSASSGLYELKVALREIRPPIWRAFRAPGSISLHRLHAVLQIVMGWTNSHLYRFEMNGQFFGRPEDFEGGRNRPTDDKKIALSAVLRQVGERMAYTYDFGDNWRHEVTLESILPADPHGNNLICMSGERHCPPEDVGGVSGYEEFLEAISDPSHEDHQAMLEWVGGRFQPEEFEVGRINAALARKRKR